MESTKKEKKKAGSPFNHLGSLRLKKSQVASAIFYALMAAAIVTAASFGLILTSKEADAAQLGVGISIVPIKINQTTPIQNKTSGVNGTNTSISLPMAYNTTGLPENTGLLNITLALPGWKKIINVRINESGVIKNVTVSGGQITFEANMSETSAMLLFDAAPPSLTKTSESVSSAFLQKNLTVESENSFTNASLSVEVNTSYAFYTLYWFNSTGFADKTIEFNLKITSGVATFDSFHTSTVLFRLEGANTCTEIWSCGAWSDSRACGTRTCTDGNHCGTTNLIPLVSSACPDVSPSPGAGTGGGGGWGGGGGASGEAKAAAGKKIPAASALHVSTAEQGFLKVFIKPGELKKASFSITNTGDKKLKLDIRHEGLNNFLTLATSYVELNPGDSRSIELLVLADTQVKPGTYSGKVVISTEQTEELAVNVLLEVAPLNTLFDTLVNVNPKTKSVLPGDSVVADIAIFNLLGTGKFDVRLIYGVKDNKDEMITSKQQTVAVETRAGLAAVLEVPRDIPPGQYNFFAVVQLNTTTVGVGSDTFEVLSPLKLGAEAPASSNIFFIILFSLLMLTLTLTFISLAGILRHHFPQKSAFGHHHKHAKPAAPKRPAGPKFFPAKPLTAITAATTATQKPVSQKELEKKLEALEQAFSEGIVSVKAYIEDKTKIENALKKIKAV